MKHSIVCAEEGMYCGWPANHGKWQWDDHFLFGFLRGKYRVGFGGMHNIEPPFEKMLARSLDGGNTWTIEKPNVDFEGAGKAEILAGDNGYDYHEHIVRVCGIYDHGGENCIETGAIYLSGNSGREWWGPFDMRVKLGPDEIFTGRTNYLDNMLFASIGNRDFWGLDYAVCLEYKIYGEMTSGWKIKSIICQDDARAVMPAVARLSNGDIYCALRRRKTGRRSCWVDLYKSSDYGKTWGLDRYVDDTGGHNGNPPALIAVDDKTLFCAYGNRDYGAMHGAIIDTTKGNHKYRTIRMSTSPMVDIGYPQLFKRSNGTIVCVYYWADYKNVRQHIAQTEFKV